MAYQLAKKLLSLSPYDPIEGEYEIRLDANESFFDINSEMSELFAAALAKVKFNRYPDPYSKNAVNAFAGFYNLKAEYVTAGNGSDELISIIAACFLEKGDKVVALTPDFSMYAFYSNIYELEIINIDKNFDLEIDIDGLIKTCNESGAKALMFSNPCNPTSLGINKADVLKILGGVNCLVVLDEAYMDFWSESLLDEIENFDNLIILKTCSKAIGMAGIRMGFAVAGKTITNALKMAKSPYNTDSISQKLAEVAFGMKDKLKSVTSEITLQRECLQSGLQKLQEKFPTVLIKVFDSVTNFVFIKTSSEDLIFEELKKKSIMIRKLKGYLRITAGNAKENARLLSALEQIISNI